jgi:7,8-dihydropterin-6-yl-methyl-4-(beta-D-ribofuranosyl)aminobenzene 5'-phosphate synthase
MNQRFRVSVAVVLALCLVVLVWLLLGRSGDGDSLQEPAQPGAKGPGEGERFGGLSDDGPPVPLDRLSIAVTYDNNPHVDGLKTAWGFSCVIRGTDKTILFDTGGEGEILLDNMARMGVEPDSIDVVVLSHAHGDHTGGLRVFLRANPDVEIYLPASFDNDFKDGARSLGAGVVDISDPTRICRNVYSTGEMGISIKEQALVVRTSGGILVITGCAHPGIVEMVGRARAITGDGVLLALGGFHLVRASGSEIGRVVEGLKELGVKHVAPCHCSGETARAMCRNGFGLAYIDAGVGRLIASADLN